MTNNRINFANVLKYNESNYPFAPFLWLVVLLFYFIILFSTIYGYRIEHKYLVINDEYKKLASDSHHIKQAYISRNKERTVRVRILDNSGFITIKGKNIGDTRSEYEYQIPKVDAEELIANLCEPFVLEKIRYIVSYMGNTWEVDEFKGELEGLIIAEIEIPYSEYEYGKPDFIGENVTDDPRYYNSNLSKK